MLREAIKSVFNGKHQDFDCYIVDDGSDFDTEALLEEFSDERLILAQAEKISAEERVSSPRVSKNLNSVLETLKEGFVVYLCDDDVLHPDWLWVCSATLGHEEEIHILVGKTWYFYNNNNPWVTAKPGFPVPDPNLSPSVIWWNLGGFTHRVECFYEGLTWGKGFEDNSHSFDVPFIELAHEIHPTYLTTDAPSVYVRVHGNSLSARIGRMDDDRKEFRYASGPLLEEHIAGYME